METSGKYWVVSPNVRFNPRTVNDWRQASVKRKAAFMGWQPDDDRHRLGPKFAHAIQPGDTILIARRFGGKPETVGFGTVVGGFKTRLSGFKPHEPFGSLRQLDPFVPMSRPPANLPLLEAVNQTAALHQLHPEWNPQHKALCRWLDAKLATAGKTERGKRSQRQAREVKFGPLPSDGQLEYQVRTPELVKQAKKREAALVTRYRLWIEHQDRKLRVFRVHRLQCDAFEEARHNLIEAKCSANREYVRMAVGQLLDYAFQAQDEIGECHKAILVPNKPDMSLVRWLETLGISVIWEDGSVFLDNSNGQFT